MRLSLVASFVLVMGPQIVRAQEHHPAIPVHQDPVVQGVQDGINRLCEAHDARLAAIRDEAQLEQELTRSRGRFLAMLDLDLKKTRPDPKVTVVATLDFPDYRIEKVVVESAPGIPVTCNVYVPRGGPARKPALLSPHGHSGRDRPVYQNAYQRFVKAGFIVLAKDGWGKQERRATGHGEAGGQLALTGTSLMALEIFDNIRCVDYLLGRPDVDAERLGMAGISGGGSQTLYTAAIEGRIRAASPTCAVTTFRSDLADTGMCVCEMSQGILTIGDHGLFLAMAYPRPLLVVNGTRDEIFPIQGARAAVAQARQLYGRGGHADRVQFAEFDSLHTWSDPMIDRQIHWFRSQFGLPDQGDLPQGEGPRDPELLRCYPDGDLPAGSQTLAGFNRARMPLPTLSKGETTPLATDVEQLKEQLRTLWSSEPSPPGDVQHRDLGHDPAYNLDRERLSWRSGLGGPVVAEVFRPASAEAREKAPLIVHLERDRQEPRLERLFWDERFRQHATVVNLKTTGDQLSPGRQGQVSSALLASGKSLMAERIRDLLVGLEVLRDRGLRKAGRPLVLVGHGSDGVLLLFAAPFLPADATLVLDQTPISYRVGAEVNLSPSQQEPPFPWTIVPGFATRHDLLDLLEVAHPRRVLLAHPLDSAQQAFGRDELAAHLERLVRTNRGHLEIIAKDQPRADVFHRLNQVLAESAR